LQAFDDSFCLEASGGVDVDGALTQAMVVIARAIRVSRRSAAVWREAFIHRIVKSILTKNIMNFSQNVVQVL